MAQERPLLAFARKTLDEGGRSVRVPLPAEWLTRKLAEVLEPGTTISASQDGGVDLHLGPAGGEQFLVQGQVFATLDMPCGRCLGPAKCAVTGEMSLLLVPTAQDRKRAPKGKRASESEGEFEFDPSEADVATYDGETVILDDVVREAILLEIPISPLCSEACSGMAPSPTVAHEAAVDIDPRLAPLAALRDRLGHKG